jgi:hypothetical protein
MNGLVVECPQLNAFDFCCFIHPHIDGQYQSAMFMNHLFYDHGFEGLSWKWTNNVLTIFHLKSVFFMMSTRLLCWCTKINPMSCNHIMRHQRISRDKCACDRIDIYTNVHDFVQEVSITQAISKHDQLEKCIWWWTEVPNLTEKKYQCPRSAHKSFRMRSVFHFWSFS